MRRTKSLLSMMLAVAMACALVVPAAAVEDTQQVTDASGAMLSVAETGTDTYTVSLKPNDSGIACVQFNLGSTGLTVTDAQPEADADFAYHGYGNSTYAAAGRDAAVAEDTVLLTITAADTTAAAIADAISDTVGYKVDGTTSVPVTATAETGSTGGYTVSGTVTSYLNDTDALTVTLYDEAGTVKVADATVGEYANGTKSGQYTSTYEFKNVPEGVAYTLKVEKRGHAPWTESIENLSADIAKDVAIYQYGDVNMNGSVTAIDALQVSQTVAKTRVLSEYQKLLADVNGKNGITSTDALWIKQRTMTIRNAYYEKASQ